MIKIRENVKLAPYATFKIGGLARFFVIVTNINELKQAIAWAARTKVTYFILGNGSNVLFDDNGYDGLIIKIKLDKIKITKNIVYCQAGILLSKLVSLAQKAGLSGLEWSVGIPGTVGGAIWGNVGAFGLCLADYIEEVEILDEGKITKIKKSDLKFGYRSSVFQHNSFIILAVKLKLITTDLITSRELVKKYSQQRIAKQPQGFSAGSVFKNPKLAAAGKLIEECGLKGKRIGNAQISTKHANFIINLNSARAADVLALISLIKKEVYNKFKVKLKEEIVILPNS